MIYMPVKIFLTRVLPLYLAALAAMFGLYARTQPEDLKSRIGEVNTIGNTLLQNGRLVDLEASLSLPAQPRAYELVAFAIALTFPVLQGVKRWLQSLGTNKETKGFREHWEAEQIRFQEFKERMDRTVADRENRIYALHQSNNAGLTKLTETKGYLETAKRTCADLTVSLQKARDELASLQDLKTNQHRLAELENLTQAQEFQIGSLTHEAKQTGELLERIAELTAENTFMKQHWVQPDEHLEIARLHAEAEGELKVLRGQQDGANLLAIASNLAGAFSTIRCAGRSPDSEVHKLPEPQHALRAHYETESFVGRA